MQRHFFPRPSTASVFQHYLRHSSVASKPSSAAFLRYAQLTRPITTSKAAASASSSAAGAVGSSAPRSRFPVKTISLSLALTSASLGYLYSQQSKGHRFGVSTVEAEASAPISAFSVSSPSATMSELMDDDNRAALQAKSTEELVLALFVYKLCSYSWIVDAAPHIIKLAESLHLTEPVYWFVKNTFFRQFCGGETPEECVASMERLAQSGINCILDLSVEADLHLDDAEVTPQDADVSRGKYWRQEQNADVIVAMIKNCLRTAADGQQANLSNACAAIKVTAFAPPELLLRINQVLYRLEQSFETHQRQGKVNVNAVRDVIHQVLPPSLTEAQQAQREALVARLQDTNGTLDRIEFFKLFNLQGPGRDIWWATSANDEKKALLTKDELAAYDRMVHRLNEVCSLAHEKHVGVMVDAEQSYFQEAIDHVAMNLQAKFNRRDDHKHAPTVYNTYQMYTKIAQGKLERDVELAKRDNFTFAAKLVRGAYMVSERKRATQMGYPSPIHDTLEDTHASYNGGVRFLLEKLHEHQETTGETLTSTTAPIVFMVASHNRDSVLLTVEEMERHNVLPRAGVVHFGQLFGMQDQISYTLGKNGYSIYKYLPYGKIDEVIPYLLRRAQENSAVLGAVTKERALMVQEVKDRLSGVSPGISNAFTPALPASSPVAAAAPVYDTSETSDISITNVTETTA
ncbi:FAD-linked oxidoreductase-like protein [Radiomyces spectabilis]|uniref:FAD-linked oxidoreductase-like protein n=1 Tax=Radiomyces spectabilis TaxID=64574 RepID=UPI0022205E49|nr:FAD-linked oxidoreductase-like protein [Radiomyces spectabilis]KAI8384287.1 FAD-linked oxidoreductase-like protein [Radiomyces spectabilis]